MISQKTIQNVHDLSRIEEVIQGYDIALKKRGANYLGCCPFHDEKTPSFTVSPAKNIYKCFGCGESGNAIKFVMKFEGIAFAEAIERLADQYGIEIEKTVVERDPKKLELEEELKKVNAFALKRYRDNYLKLQDDDEIKKYILERLTISDTLQWQIGIAGNDGKFLSSPIIDAGLFEAGKTAGLINDKEGSTYDFFRNRIIYPILDENGIDVLGFSGRAFPGADKKYAKYMNSAETPLYVKSKILYGFHFAKKEISKTRTAYLVEGNHDVIAMHRQGFTNTVGTCGTALTEFQAKYLQRLSDRVVIIRDGDAAGIKAAKRDTQILMKFGISVDVVFLPDGEDPDSFTTFFERISIASKMAIFGFEFKSFIIRNSIDSILWLFNSLLEGTEKKLTLRAKGISEIITLLKSIPDETVKNTYIDALCREQKIKASDFSAAKKTEKKKELTERQVIDLTEEDEILKKLTIQQREDFIKFGFFEVRDGNKTGYYFRDGYGGSFKPRTNFLIEPLYHVFGGDNRRMIKAINNVQDDEVIEMNSKNMLSKDSFCSVIYDKGHFIPREGFSTDHLLRIHNKIGNKYPRVYEITCLGMQPEGFFAFQNKVYKPATAEFAGQLCEYNEYGIVEVGGKLYLSPSLSKTYEGLRENENPYENDLYLQWKESPIKFPQWASLMSSVYGKNGWMGIAWSIGTLFRDILYKTAPLAHINPYGQKGSGKSEFGNSLNWLFFSGKDSNGELYKPMNLNQGTDFAFFNRYERFSNCPNVLNEFDENAIKEEWFRAIKSSHDGEGREKGKGIKNQTGSQKIRSSTCIQGQYLSTKDDNSVLSRSLPLAFTATENRPESQVLFYRKLKEHESKGLSSILCELLDLRKDFSKDYAELFYENMKTMQDLLFKEGIQSVDRLLKNVTGMVTCIQIAATKFELPFTVEEFKNYAKEFLTMTLNLVAKTSKLAEFWKTVEFMMGFGILEEGYDYEIIPGAGSVKIKSGKEIKDEVFSEPKDLLLIRFNSVYQLYSKEYRMSTGQKPTNDETIKLYLNEQKYFIGTKQSHKFWSNKLRLESNTSCMVLDLDKIGISVAMPNEDADSDKVVGMVGVVTREPEPSITEGTWGFSIKSMVIKEEGTKDETMQEIYIKCFTRNPAALMDLKELKKLKFSGNMLKNYRGKQLFYTMQVEKWETEQQGEIDFEKNGTDDELPF